MPTRQRSFKFRTWGGEREGAGRKPKGKVAGRPHEARPPHSAREPVHVTLRTCPEIPQLREEGLGGAIAEVMKARALRQDAKLRVVHYSIQASHLHLLVEADDRRALMYGIRGLEIQLARRINRVLGRPGGKVWHDRYDARACRSPTEVRNRIVYVLNNVQHHSDAPPAGVDPYSSGAWFDGWRDIPAQRDPAPVAAPRTFLLRTGWKRARGGLISIREKPR